MATSSAILSYNCPEFLQTIFAANYLGAIAMPINWRLAAPEVRYILEHSQARALVCDESLIDLAAEATMDMTPALVRVVFLADILRRMDPAQPTSPRPPAVRHPLRRRLTTSTA